MSKLFALTLIIAIAGVLPHVTSAEEREMWVYVTWYHAEEIANIMTVM